MADVQVVVVDNASPDRSLEAVADLPVRAIQNPRNGGFSYGVNTGWRAGSAPFVMLLNPDAVIDEASVRRLVAVLEEDPGLGAAAPRITNADGSLQWSLRRFPRLRSTYAQALFLHRLAPGAAWADEVIRDRRSYEQRWEPEWASGACILARRSVLERLGGLDEGFFLYGEDKDLCRRIRDLGLRIAYEPNATCSHVGGASAPRPGLFPVLAASRVRYAHKHSRWPARVLERGGIALGAATHALVGRGGRAAKAGHLAALRVSLGVAGARGRRP
jgi:GT2 family glycosyltransferase